MKLFQPSIIHFENWFYERICAAKKPHLPKRADNREGHQI